MTRERTMNGVQNMNRRRRLLQGSLALGGLAGLGGCATVPAKSAPSKFAGLNEEISPLTPLRPFAPIPTGSSMSGLHQAVPGQGTQSGHRTDRRCAGGAQLRPWRQRLVAVLGFGQCRGPESHVGSPKEIAVIGCGIVGLTAPSCAARRRPGHHLYPRIVQPHPFGPRQWQLDAGFPRLPDRTGGTGFGALWERMARYSYKTFAFIWGFRAGRSISPTNTGSPIRHSSPAKTIPDPAKGTYGSTGMPQQNFEFGHYRTDPRSYTQAQVLPEGASPFRSNMPRAPRSCSSILAPMAISC